VIPKLQGYQQDHQKGSDTSGLADTERAERSSYTKSESNNPAVYIQKSTENQTNFLYL